MHDGCSRFYVLTIIVIIYISRNSAYINGRAMKAQKTATKTQNVFSTKAKMYNHPSAERRMHIERADYSML